MWETQHNNVDWDSLRTLILPEIWQFFWNVCISLVSVDLVFERSVNKFARAVTKTCDKRLARLSAYIHSSHMWSQTILSWGKHSTIFQIRIVSRLWFCWRLWRLEVNIRRNSVHFRNPNVLAENLDVQETDFCFARFYRSWGDFSRCCFTHEWHSHSRSLGFGDWSISFLTKPNHAHQSLTNIDHAPSSGTHSGSNAMLYVFEDTEAVIKMIIECRSPMMRHVSRTVRVALDWLFDRIKLIQKFQFDTLTSNINSQTFWPKVISHVTNGTNFFICST